MNRSDSVPAPMVQIPAEAVEKLREALRFQFSPPKRSQVDAVFTAASAVVDAADTPRDTCTHGNDIRVRCEDCEGWTDMGNPDPAPAAPPKRCLACLHPFDGHEGLTCAEMEAKHGVVPPARVPVSDEAPPPVSAEEGPLAAFQHWFIETDYDHTDALHAAFLAGWHAAKGDA